MVIHGGIMNITLILTMCPWNDMTIIITMNMTIIITHDHIVMTMMMTTWQEPQRYHNYDCNVYNHEHTREYKTWTINLTYNHEQWT